MTTRGIGYELHSRRGFTLIEVLVALVVAVVIAGGVMGVIASAHRFTFHVNEKSADQPILEAAAQELLAHPDRADEGSLEVGSGKTVAVVTVSTVRVQDSQGKMLGNKTSELCRVRLAYHGQVLDFSLLVPMADSK